MAKIKNFRLNRQSTLLPLAVAAIGLLVVLVGPSSFNSCVSAGVKNPIDYCYQQNIEVTYSGSGTLNDAQVRIPTDSNALLAGNKVDDQYWQIFGVQGSLSNEINLTAQNINASDAAFWYQVPEISTGETVTLRMYMLNDEQQRDQGILFEGADELSASHASAMNITDNLHLTVDLNILTTDSHTGTIVSHYDTATSTGYAFNLIDDAGTLKFQALIDNQDCELTVPTYNELDRYEVDFVAPDLSITRNGVLLVSCNTGLFSISTPTTQLTAGSDLARVIIRNIDLVDNVTVVGRWGFNPGNMAETSAVDPVYQGTIQDAGVNNLDFLYTFNRPQSNFSATAGSITVVGTASIISLPAHTVDILGPPFGASISTPVPGVSSGIFYDLYPSGLVTGAGAIDAPPGMVYMILLGGLGLFLAVVVYIYTKYVPLGLFVAGLPLALGSINGWVPYWAILFWAALVVFSWFSLRGAES